MKHWIMALTLLAGSECLSVLVMSLLCDIPFTKLQDNNFLLIISILCSKNIFFIGYIIIKQFIDVSPQKRPLSQLYRYAGIPILTVISMFVLSYLRANNNKIERIDLASIIFFVLLLGEGMRSYRMAIQYDNMKKQQRIIEKIQKKFAEWKKADEKSRKAEEELKEIVHDMKYHLRQIGRYAKDQQYKKIEQILSDLRIEFAAVEEQFFSSNRLVNSILTDAYVKAKKEKIMMDIFVEVGFKIDFIADMDLAVILGNLLDNAIEAAKKCENGKIKVRMFMQNSGSHSVMCIENNYTGEIIQKNKKILSTKSDHQLHGIGISSASDMVEQYEGYMNQDFEGAIFRTLIVIPVK
jgi:signal transduction histidine kinase